MSFVAINQRPNLESGQTRLKPTDEKRGGREETIEREKGVRRKNASHSWGLTNVPLCPVFVHNAGRREEGERVYQPECRKKNYTQAGLGGKRRRRVWGIRGYGDPVRLDVEEFRSDGESKGPVRESARSLWSLKTMALSLQSSERLHLPLFLLPPPRSDPSLPPSLSLSLSLSVFLFGRVKRF